MQVLAPAQMGRMCAAAWPHMLDFPALVHVVAARMEKSHSEQMLVAPMQPAVPDFLNHWLSKQPLASGVP